MTKNRDLIPTNQEEQARLLSPTDSKQWDVVQRVLAEFSKDCTTTVDACKAAGINRATYYNALANPVVQQLRLQQMMSTIAATQHLIERNWMPVVANMLSIASNDDSREAVQAARLVKDIYKDVQDGLGPGGHGGLGEETDAAKAIRQFLGGKKVKRLIQTTTVQEVEVVDDISDGNGGDVVEGEVTPLA